MKCPERASAEGQKAGEWSPGAREVVGSRGVIHGHRVLFWGHEYTLKLDSGDGESIQNN